MDYLRNERDVEFVLFEQLQIQSLTQLPAFSAFSTDDFKAFIAEALKFAKNEIAPINAKGDREGCKLKDGKVFTPEGFKRVYQLFAQSGFIGIDVPATYGGMGLPQGVSIAMMEAFVGAGVAFSMYPGLTRGSAHLIEAFGPPALAERFVPNMYGGTWAGTMCLTEPQAGSAVGDLKTSATPVGDGTYKIKGSKIFISGGDHDLADNVIHLVLARVEGDAAGTKGISLFAVPRTWVNDDGSLAQDNDVKVVNIEHKMGINGNATCLLSFGDGDICRGYLVGDRGKGMNHMFQMMNEARLLTGMQGMATAGTAYEYALNYAKDRTQFGATPIIEFPDVRRNLMFMKSYVEGMRALLYQTALFIDLEAHSADEKERAYYEGLVGVLTPICKAYCSDQGFRVTELAMQVYGGYGYCSEYPVEQYLRDVKISSIYEGTNGIQALDLVGRKLGLHGGKAFQSLYALIDGFCTENKTHDALKTEIDELKKAIDTVAQMAMKFMELSVSGNRDYPALSATPFLAACGDTVLAYLLLKQAVIAGGKLAGQPLGSGDARKKALENNETLKFYDGKIHTARFFVHHILPQVRARGKEILSLDRSALDVVF